MTSNPIIEGIHQAALWAKATKGGTELPTEADRAFLTNLQLPEPVLTLQDPLDVQREFERFECRLRCHKLGWATVSVVSRPTNVWHLTDLGRVALETVVHPAAVPQPAPGADEGEG